MGTQGLNLHVGRKALLDLRFADALLVFATSRGDTIRLLEELVTSLAQVGLKLNTSKTTKKLTTETQHGKILRTSSGVKVEILDGRCAHKWFWNIITVSIERLKILVKSNHTALCLPGVLSEVALPLIRPKKQTTKQT